MFYYDSTNTWSGNFNLNNWLCISSPSQAVFLTYSSSETPLANVTSLWMLLGDVKLFLILWFLNSQLRYSPETFARWIDTMKRVFHTGETFPAHLGEVWFSWRKVIWSKWAALVSLKNAFNCLSDWLYVSDDVHKIWWRFKTSSVYITEIV